MALLAPIALLTVAVVAGGLRRPLGLGWALAVALAGTVVSTSALGLALLDAGILAPGPMQLGMLGALLAWLGLVLGLRRRWRGREKVEVESREPDRRRLDRLGALTLLLIVGGGTAMRADPSPYLHGGQDQGIYVNVGHHIARSGRLRPVDRVMAGAVRGFVPEAIAAAHRIEPPAPDSPLAGVREGRWIAGIHVEHAASGRLVPAFFHLLPVWLALSEFELGFARSTWALVLFAALSQLAAFFLGFGLAARGETPRAATLGLSAEGGVSETRRTPGTTSFRLLPLDENPGARRHVGVHRGLLGAGQGTGAGAEDLEDLASRRRRWLLGLLAAAGLALHPLDLWIASFPVTENLARAALLGGAALALAAEAAERRGAPGVVLLASLAGASVGLGVFARGSMLALAIVLALTLLLARRDRAPRTRAALLITLVLGATLGAMQGIAHSWPYFFSAASNHFHVPRIQPRIGAALAWAAAAGVAVLLVDRALGRLRRRLTGLDDRGEALLRGLGLLALVGAAVAVVVRATDQGDAYGPSQQVVSVLLRHGGPVGLGLGVIGLAAAAWSRVRGQARVWVTLACVILLISALKEGVRYEFYYARYLVGDAIPALVVAAAWLVEQAHAWGRARVGPGRAALGLALALLAWWAPPLRVLHRPVYWLRDLEHGPEELAAMFDAVPDDAVLIFDSQAPLRWRGYLATPAFLAFDRNVLLYPNGALIERAINAGTPIYMISGGWEREDRQRWPAKGPWRTTVIERGFYRAERAEVVEGAMPRRMHEWGGPWELHRFDRSIWRGTGAFSLLPGSGFLAVDEPGRLESEALDLTWAPGAAVELLLSPRAPKDCAVEAALREADGREPTLVALSSERANLLRFAMPSDRTQTTAALVLRWRCPAGDPQPLPWRRLSMRWPRP